ncbi:unnamed protein product [Adineta steineri]|uniref:Uncharacterized protein n=2 Tax=Adineta steineri TaxID=433720 RepID=A0A819JFB9_9BILA|nr:unnamed protein product [Adineta steineri]CAF3926742.1 unnamed protein product [Adineta steineri]
MSGEVENNEREILHLHVGSGGMEVGHSSWQLYSIEHHLDNDGYVLNEEKPPKSFFSSVNNERTKFRPRALFIDPDCSTIDQIRTSDLKNFYGDHQFCVTSNCSEMVMNNIRKEIEICDYFQGFILSHSTFGKSSNLTSELLNHLKNEEYSKMTILTNSLIGSSINISHMSNLLETADIIIPMENKTISNLCKYRLDISTPTYSNINQLISYCWSNLTCEMRFEGCELHTLDEFSRVLVPHPPLKIISTHLLPLIPRRFQDDIDFKSPSVYDMCLPFISEANTCFIHDNNPYKLVLSLCLLFRGEKIVPKEIGQKLICDMKKSIRFSERVPTGFRCGINYHSPVQFRHQPDMTLTDKQVLMLTNQTTTSIYLCDLALNQTESEIDEARNSIQDLKEFYAEYDKEIRQDYQML